MHQQKYDLYPVLNSIVDLSDSHVLDYGCGNGNLIAGPFKSYTGLEADKKAYDYCKKTYGDFFIYQDLWNPAYNPQGKQLLPKLTDRYDVIFAYSVFTHTPHWYFEQCLEIFKQHSNQVIVSMVTSDNEVMLDWLMKERMANYGYWDLPEVKDYEYSIYPEHYFTIYDRDFLSNYGTLVKTELPQELLIWN